MRTGEEPIEAERDALREERDSLRAERDALRVRLDGLERERAAQMARMSEVVAAAQERAMASPRGARLRRSARVLLRPLRRLVG